MPEPMRAMGRLRLNLDGVWSVAELTDFLSKLRDSYAMFLSWFPNAEEVATFADDKYKKPGRYPSFLFPWGTIDIKNDQGRILSFPEVVYRALVENPTSVPKVFSDKLKGSDDILINSISIQSPGWIEVIGKLNPLQAIQDILVLIRDWRDKKDRSRIENDILQLEGCRLRIQMLREAGFSDPEIQQYVQMWLTPPTHFLVEITNARKVGESTCLPYPTEPKPTDADGGT